LATSEVRRTSGAGTRLDLGRGQLGFLKTWSGSIHGLKDSRTQHIKFGNTLIEGSFEIASEEILAVLSAKREWRNVAARETTGKRKARIIRRLKKKDEKKKARGERRGPRKERKQ